MKMCIRNIYLPEGFAPVGHCKYIAHYDAEAQLRSWLNKGPRTIHSEYYGLNRYEHKPRLSYLFLVRLLTQLRFRGGKDRHFFRIFGMYFTAIFYDQSAQKAKCKNLKKFKKQYMIPEFRDLIKWEVWDEFG